MGRAKGRTEGMFEISAELLLYKVPVRRPCHPAHNKPAGYELRAEEGLAHFPGGLVARQLSVRL